MWNMRGLLALLPSGIAELLQRVPPEILNRMTELRLRAGQPPAVTVGARTLFLSSEGTTVTAEKGLLIPQKTVQETLLSLCGHSLHGIEKTLDQGYYTGRAAGQRENHRTAGFVQDDLGGRAGRPLPHGADR